jgi:DNA-binding Lrp family transcriptional regulator
MPSAYVLFNIGSGSEDQILEELRGIAEVQEAFFSYGVYDLIVKIRTGSMEELKELVSHRLRIITNVKSTVTLIKAEEKKIIVTI